MPALRLSLLLLFAVSLISAQAGTEAEAVQGHEDATESLKDLGRRAKISLGKLKSKAEIGLTVGLVEPDGLGVFDALFASFSMIIVSEIGDETFIIAALMAMRHPKSIVLSGALSALFIMTVLSTGLGRIVPNLISRKHTNSAATDPKASQKKEMEEVEEKLESAQAKTMTRRIFSRFCTPIFLELATHKNAFGVAIGATIGHTLCTSLAVIGGSMLASKISQATVAMIGGLLFLGFSLSSYFYPPL